MKKQLLKMAGVVVLLLAGWTAQATENNIREITKTENEDIDVYHVPASGGMVYLNDPYIDGSPFSISPYVQVWIEAETYRLIFPANYASVGATRYFAAEYEKVLYNPKTGNYYIGWYYYEFAVVFI